MPRWPRIGGQYAVAFGQSSSTGTTVTSAGSVNAKGSWTQLIAATTFASDAILVSLLIEALTNDFLVDIGVGGSGSEQVVLANLGMSGNNSALTTAHVLLPLRIPAGSRIAARSQANQATKVIKVCGQLFAAGMGGAVPFHEVTTLGAATADSGGTAIDPGGSANTKGSYVQLSAATTRRMEGFFLHVGTAQDPSLTTGTWLVDVAVGAGGSEQVVLPNWLFSGEGPDSTMNTQYSPFIPVPIPAGSRVAVRGQSSVTDTTDRLFDVILYGVG